MADLVDRMKRAAKLDPNLYEEVEADKTAMGQATLVVVLASLAAGIGSISQGGSAGIIWGTVAALIGWYIWAFLTYIIGTKILPTSETSATYGELLRTIGFSSTPGLIRVLGIIPGLNLIVNMIAGVWMLIAMVIAVRQALDYTSTGRAVGVCIIGFIVQIIIMMIFTALFVGAKMSM